MIKLTFTINKEVMNFIVTDRNIWYKDRVWKGGVRCIPRDEEFIKKIIASRNKIPYKLISMFNLSKENQEEYNKAKDDDALAEIIIKDCKSKGLVLLSREDNG